uniref:glucuronosyltransferase n=1 Tax=Ascaris suum TaxID=6253 RepID=F1KZ92_ASCSU
MDYCAVDRVCGELIWCLQSRYICPRCFRKSTNIRGLSMTNKWIIVLLIGFVVNLSAAYKVAIFAPDVSGSQLLLNVRVAETLAASGHNVTLIRLDIFGQKKVNLKISPSIEQWRVKAYLNASIYEELNEHHSAMAFKDMTVFSSHWRNTFMLFLSTFKTACEIVTQDKEFLKKLKEAKFDIAFTHVYDYCPVGIIYYAKIPTWIWLNGAQLVEFIADLVGVPSPPSYVPPLMADSSDQMSFIERVKSFLGRAVGMPVAKRLMIDPETEILRRNLDPEMPHLSELATQCPLVMVNSDELYSFTRPTLHKIVYIGGIGMKSQHVQPLEGKFKEIVDRSKHIVVMSFGSVANASRMPDSWKDSLLGAFKQFPEIEFIMRYTAHDLDEKLPPNVHVSSWIPQVDLLQNKKTLAFISHAGFNSIQEAIHSGVPIVAIPLFGDQYVNSRLAEQRRIGIIISKSEFNELNIVHAIKEILHNNEYKTNVQQLLAMIRAKPVPSEQLLVKWTEFVAEFKTLPNLTPYGTKLGIIEYFCIDVIIFLIFTISCVVFAVAYTIRIVCRKICQGHHKITPQKKRN